MKNWEGEKLRTRKFFSSCHRTIPVCLPLIGGTCPLLPSSWGHACCDRNESESYRPTISVGTVLNSRHIRYFSANFSRTIGGEAIEKWKGKDLFSPLCIEIWRGIRPPCPTACSTPGSRGHDLAGVFLMRTATSGSVTGSKRCQQFRPDPQHDQDTGIFKAFLKEFKGIRYKNLARLLLRQRVAIFVGFY